MNHDVEIEDLKKAVFGNGRPGLVQNVTEMKVYQKELYKDVNSLATSFSALAKSQVKQDALKENRFRTIKTVSLIAGITGTIITTILKFGGIS